MPLSNARDAPRFSSEPAGFDSFFEDVEELGKRATLDNADKIKWALRYAPTESESWKQVDGYVNPPADGLTFAEFKRQVRATYPQLNDDRRYTIHDLNSLIRRTQEYQDMSRTDLGNYSRRFDIFTGYLIRKDRLSVREQSSFYLQGFPQPVRVKIVDRLKVKCPDTHPSDGYKLKDIQAAADFVLSAGEQDLVSQPNIANSLHPTQQVPSNEAKLDKLLLAVTTLTESMAINRNRDYQATQQPPLTRQQPANRYPYPAPGGASSNAPQWSQGYECLFCSSRDHLLRECPIADQYVRESKVNRNAEGKLTLPNGRYLHRGIPGRNFRERFDNYWASEGIQGRDNNAPGPAATNFFESSDESAFAFSISPVEDPRDEFDNDVDIAEQAQIMEAQINSIRDAQTHMLQTRKKPRFDGVEVPPKIGFPPKRPAPAPASASSQAPVPTILKRGQPFPSTKDDPPSSHVGGKQGMRASDTPYPRPQGPMRPITYPTKPPAEDPKYHYQAPVESNVNVTDIVDRVFDTKVTMSTRELLAFAPDVRRQVKEQTASKKVAVNSFEIDSMDAYLDSFETEARQQHLDLSKYRKTSSSAEHILPLRVIYPIFAPGVQPECILDGGAQIVVMRKDIWERVRAPITANKKMPMTSANAGTTWTIGVVENHPVKIGPVTVELQIQVVEDAPFEVLLGRPFFAVLNCSESSTSGGSHEIRIKDPNTGIPYVFPTDPRPQQKDDNDKPKGPAVNFRL